MTKPLNRKRRFVKYHPSAQRNAFVTGVKRQRTRGWFKERYETPDTGSRLNTILYENFYDDEELERPEGVPIVVFNRQVLFEQLTGQTDRAKMQNTKKLYTDDIRRGVVGEPVMDKLYEVWSQGRWPLEMPSILRPGGFTRVSADGQDPVTGCAIEYKMPRFVKDWSCAEPFTKKVYTCGWEGSWDQEKHPCLGYHERHGCSYETVEVECGRVDKCAECLRMCCKQYWHQCQAEADHLDAPATIFIQLYSYEAIDELLGIKWGRDDGLDEYKQKVSEFCSRPWCDISFPKGKNVLDYIKVLRIPRDYNWFQDNVYLMWEFHKAVMEKRKELGMDFDTFAEKNNLRFVEDDEE